MFLFKHNDWENTPEVFSGRATVVSIENKGKLWSYLSELTEACEGGESGFLLTDKKYEKQSIQKFCRIETNLPGLTLNSKKLITALYKKYGAITAEPEYEYEFKSKVEELYCFCKKISTDVGYDVVLNEDCDAGGVFKLFSLELKENYKRLLEKLTAYVNACAELLKTKIFIFLFLTKFLSNEELKLFLKHCEIQDVSLILIEDGSVNIKTIENIEIQELIIDSDLCEIFRK
ncbi:MAG: type II-A CRISPR-associated protein Csn2 [Clostridiales bacterium]|jgi:CRISPR-associated protein Csn2|nr:type II-A CRISPR-associated protein Csn2 [Clostridiales bacterium]